MTTELRKLTVVSAMAVAITWSGTSLADAGTHHARKGRLIPAKGEFTVDIDFTTLKLSPVKDNCAVQVEGTVTLTGTLEGVAPGRTQALALADCETVRTLPPGSYEDVFKSKLEFVGMVRDKPAFADITYRGDTQIGGGIEALMLLSDGLRGVLKVEAIVAEGGSYEGFIRTQ